MSLITSMIGNNVPLSTWKTYDERRTQGGVKRRREDNLAAEIVRQITHHAVVELLANEWENLGSDLRGRITRLCNERRDQPQSGNQSRMIERLNQVLGGRLLRAADEAVSVRDRRFNRLTGEMMIIDRRVNQAAAIAEQRAMDQRHGGGRKKKKKEKG